MKFLNSIITILITLTVSVHADSYIIPFYGATNYTDSKKDSSTNYGLYYQSQNFKAMVERKDIEFRSDNNLTNFTQTNMALGYNYELSNTLDLYAALHYISSSRNSFDGAYALLIGAKKQFNSFLLGLNYSYSYYDQNIVDTVGQVTPYIGFSYGDYKSLMGSYYIKITGDYIYLDEKTLSSDYIVAGISITQNKGSFQNSISYFGGDHIFALRNDGMSMQNLLEIYDSSISISSKYNFSDTTALQLSFIRKDFIEYKETAKSKSESTLVFLYYKF